MTTSSISTSMTSSDSLFALFQEWQQGQQDRASLAQALSDVPAEQGEHIQALILEWLAKSESTTSHTTEDAEQWRAELMAARARTWNQPHRAAMLLSPNALILTDGEHGFILREKATQPLDTDTAGSLLLLAQTLVMAQTALDARELSKIREQRIDSTSTSLSEMEPLSE